MSTADTLYARNPEQVLLRIDKERSREEAETDRERAEARARRRRRRARLGRRRSQWAQSALRRTTLAPGMRTSGFVYVPVDPRAYTLVLNVNGRSGVVTVPFRQTRHEP